ncbi:MAG: AAA family ATPase, partial [Actinobacteria bacterium]|nr:AAA family ATPase [Actinomycetota bacterium]
MEPLRIYLFGGFLLERSGVALPPIASRAGRSVFAHLVMNRDRPLQRDLLAGTFWPDMPEGRARRRLSHTLWQIHDVVNQDGSSHLAVTSDTLAFDTTSPYWLDVEEFERHFEVSTGGPAEGGPASRLDGTSLRACVELYRGDFLAGFFDDWVIVDQDHYRQRYLVVLRRLIDVTKAGGDYEEALAHARRLTHHDPLTEEVHREVMRLCFLLGRTEEAVQQFERCRSVLAEELEAEPSPATVVLHEKILRQRRAGIRPVRGEPARVVLGPRVETPFVGREEERRKLVDHMERVLAGPGGVVLLEGEPGVGKTRLALEAAEDARWRGFEVSWGSCTPGAVRPFAALVEVLDSLSPLRVEQLAELVPAVWLGETSRLAHGLRNGARTPTTQVPLRPAEESTRMREALVHTLGALGEITPHLVIIDDVQWADRDTLAVIGQLGPRLAGSRTLLLLLYRSEEARGDPEVWDMLREGDRVAGLGRVVLSPLSVFELEEMVRRTLGLARLDPAVAAQLHRQTGGNALFSLETLLAMRDRGLFEAGDPATVLERQLTAREVPVAPRVRSVIDSRMSLLREDVASVLELIAVFGHSIDLAVLAQTAELDRLVVLDAVDELAHRGLVRDGGEGRFGMTHDQVRQVVYDRIEHRRRVGLHRQVAETLTQVDPDAVEAIGYHFWEGEAPRLAASRLLEAGLRAMGVNAYGTAQHHLETARRAAAEAGWPASERYRLLGQLEDVLGVLGRREQQGAVLDEMASLIGASHRLTGDLGRRRAWLLAHTADFAAAEKAATRSVGMERRHGDDNGLAMSLVALGTCLRWAGRPLEAIPHLEEAVTVSGEEVQRADALTELASTLVEVQRVVEAIPRLDLAVEIYTDAGHLRGLAEADGIRGRGLHRVDAEGARTAYQKAIGICREIGYRHGEGVNLVNLSLLEQMLGGVAAALEGYDRAAHIFGELGNHRGEAMVLANSAWARQAILGDHQRAVSDATRAMRHFIEIGDRAREAQCLEIIAGVAIDEGRHSEGIRLLEESLVKLTTTGQLFLEAQHLRSLALAQVKHGDLEVALETLDRAQRVCDQAGFNDIAIELLSIRALAHKAMGAFENALAESRGAVTALTDRIDRPYLLHHRHSLVAEAAGKHEEARLAALRAQELLAVSLTGLTPEAHRIAMTRVPEHRAIYETATRFAPSTVRT